MITNEFDTICFKGALATYKTLDASAAANAGRIGPSEENIVDLTVASHGFLAGPNVMEFNCVYILGSTNYSGLKRIFDIPDANSIRIYSPFTAETPGGTETLRTAYKSSFPFKWLGFEIHLNAASATSENLVVSKDSARDTGFDVKLYSKDMNGVQDIVYMVPEEEPVRCEKETVIDLTWANTNAKTWGIKFFVQQIV
jgi:hypothetical protein